MTKNTMVPERAAVLVKVFADEKGGGFGLPDCSFFFEGASSGPIITAYNVYYVKYYFKMTTQNISTARTPPG